MAKPAGNHVLTRIGGVVHDDTWTVGVWWGITSGTISQANLDLFTQGILDLFNSVWWNPGTNSWKSMCSGGTGLSRCDSFLYTDGTLTLESNKTQTTVAGTGTAWQPAYVALVATLRTGGFGRRRRGRLYLPLTGSNLKSTVPGLGQSQVSQAQVNNLASCLSAASVIGTDWAFTSEVMSEVGSMANPITSIRVDSLPDTQRGRQSKAIASQTLTAVVA